MYDRFIYSAWRMIVLGLIFILGCTAMFLLYQGMLAGLAMRFADAAAPIITGLVLTSGIWWIVRNRNDLVYS